MADGKDRHRALCKRAGSRCISGVDDVVHDNDVKEPSCTTACKCNPHPHALPSPSASLASRQTHLRCGCCAKGLEHNVRNALTCQHISTHHRRAG
jgi:hypothetical protein